MIDNIIVILKIIEKLFFQRPDFWNDNYLNYNNYIVLNFKKYFDFYIFIHWLNAIF